MKLFTKLWCRCGPFPAAIEALQKQPVKELLRNMVSGIFPMSKGLEAFELAKAKGSLKVVINMEL